MYIIISTIIQDDVQKNFNITGQIYQGHYVQILQNYLSKRGW